MERKKNQISTLLLIVGVIFILIAGSIFVTTAWQHLSETGKRVILTGIVIGLYVASAKLREKGILTKTEHALYYLATAGTGFITVLILGGWNTVNGYLDTVGTNGLMNNADRAMWGLLAASVSIAYRYFKEKKIWDFGILTFIFINMFFLVFDANINDMAGVLPLIGIVLLITSKYLDTQNVGYRIAQSIGFIVINYFFLGELYNTMDEVMDFSDIADFWWFFAALFVDLILMVVLKRKELIYAAVTTNWFLVTLQLFCGLDEWHHDNHFIYEIIPYATATAISFLIMWYKDREDKYKYFAIMHGLMAALEVIMFFVSKTEWYDDLGWDMLNIAAMCMCIMIAFVFEMVDCVLVNDIAKRIMKTFALFFMVVSTLFLSPVIAPKDFEIEIMSLFFGTGIVLLGMIWYDKINGIRNVQFVLTCVTLVVLLFHNIEVEELANLMFLGITGIIMLVAASIKNHREYVIASSVTLSLLAIYLTRQFWLSIAWWVYLFVAGVILVGIAIKKEREA